MLPPPTPPSFPLTHMQHVNTPPPLRTPGKLRDVPAAADQSHLPKRPLVDAYPVQEKGGFVWLFFGSRWVCCRVYRWQTLHASAWLLVIQLTLLQKEQQRSK